MSKYANMLAAAALVAKRADMETQAGVEGIYRSHAYRMLDLFRDLVAEHKTHNHKITITSGMGTAFVCIDGRPWGSFPGRTWTPLFDTLNWIEAQFDHIWDYFIPNDSPLN